MFKFFTRKDLSEKDIIPTKKENDFTQLDYNPSQEEENDDILNRLGKITFTSSVLMEKPIMARAILSKLLLLEVQHDAINNTVTYVGYSMDFDVSPSNMSYTAPTYSCEIKVEGDVENKEYFYKIQKQFDPLVSREMH